MKPNSHEQTIREWVSQRESFWIKELLLFMDDTSENHKKISGILKKLRKEGVIQCCTIRKNERKYLVIKKKI